jgi:hypothetical protein
MNRGSGGGQGRPGGADDGLDDPVADDGEIIRGTIRFTEDDVRRGLRDRSPLGRVYGAFAAALFVVLGAMAVASGNGSLLLVGGVWAWLAVARWRAAAATLRAQHLDEGEVSYRFDEGGVTICAPGRTASTAYRVLDQFAEGRSAFLLHSPTVVNVIPKRAFAPEDLPRLRALLAASMQAAPRLRPADVVLMVTMAATLSVALFSLVVHQLAR